MKRFFTDYRSPLTVAIFIIVLGGMFAYSKLKTSLFPEITFPKIKVIADAGEQPVDQMMLTITRPLELAIKKVPELQNVRSSTSRGNCEISAFMVWNSDIDLAQQRIESRIAEIRNTLPANVQITVERMNPSILPVIWYLLDSKSRSPIDLKYLATYTIKPFLSQVEGVSEIRIVGGKEKEYWVILDQQKMARLAITPEKIKTALNETDFILSNGFLSDYRMLYLTVTNATANSRSKLEKLVIGNDGKRIITLRDMAQIEIREAKEYVKINANGKEGILIGIIKQPNANLIDLSEKMQVKLAELIKTLPTDIIITTGYIQSDFVHDSIRSVSDSLWIGLILAMVVAILFLRSFKASSTILLTVPVTLLLTLIVFNFTNQTFNIMTLGAIAASIGLIIDDAIVVTEQIHRMHEANPGEKSSGLVQEAIRYLFPAMLGSSLSTIVIFFPFVLMTGVAGAYFKVMTDAMIVILVCSFFVTWVGLPIIYLLLTQKENNTVRQRQKDIEYSVRRQEWVNYFIHRPWLSVSFLLFLVLCIFLILPRLETGFLPDMDEGSIVLDYKSPAGTSLEETDHILREVEKIIVSIPEVANYSRRTGTQMGFFITEPNNGDYLIELKKKRKRTTDEVIDEIRTKIEATQPALEIDFGQVIGDMLGDLMESVQPVEIKIFGNDRKKLEAYSKQVAGIIENIKGTADVFSGIIMAGPYIDIEPDAVSLARYGITPADFQYQVQTAIEGNVEGTVFEKEQLTPVRLIYPASNSMNLNKIRQLQLFQPDGKLQSIVKLATISVLPGDAEIQRENLQNMGVVTARLNNRDLGSVMSDIQTEISTAITLPQGYSIEYGGAYAQQQQSFRELLIILITSSLLVFCVILAIFKEFRIAVIILLIAVLGIAGSYIALFIMGTPLNVGSYTGLIMIVGIIAENAIFTFHQFRKENSVSDLDNAIVKAVSIRLRPNLMTALGAIIALMPIALGIGAGAQMHRPLAIAIIGGFLIAMPLLLIVLPTLIWMSYRGKE
jgi:CzcA family heavy metal efflux pump